jgi:hypothetical protein
MAAAMGGNSGGHERDGGDDGCRDDQSKHGDILSGK